MTVQYSMASRQNRREIWSLKRSQQCVKLAFRGGTFSLSLGIGDVLPVGGRGGVRTIQLCWWHLFPVSPSYGPFQDGFEFQDGCKQNQTETNMNKTKLFFLTSQCNLPLRTNRQKIEGVERFVPLGGVLSIDGETELVVLFEIWKCQH